jgi:hypothetical protein
MTALSGTFCIGGCAGRCAWPTLVSAMSEMAASGRKV